MQAIQGPVSVFVEKCEVRPDVWIVTSLDHNGNEPLDSEEFTTELEALELAVYFREFIGEHLPEISVSILLDGNDLGRLAVHDRISEFWKAGGRTPPATLIAPNIRRVTLVEYLGS